MVGYIINDFEEEKAMVYYKKIKIDDSSITIKKNCSKRIVHPKKENIVYKPLQKWSNFESILNISNLKYNGETDQYLFKDMNTIYSIQLYQT